MELNITLTDKSSSSPALTFVYCFFFFFFVECHYHKIHIKLEKQRFPAISPSLISAEEAKIVLLFDMKAISKTCEKKK